MAALSTYLANALLNATLQNSSYSTPAVVYVSLGTTNQNATNGATEVTGGSYARQSLTFGTPASGAAISNTLAATFASMPSCTVVSVSIFDALINGNLLYWDNISSQIVNAGGSFVITVGSVTATMS